MRDVVSFTLRSDGKEFSEGNRVKSVVIVNEANRIPRATILLLDGDPSKQNFPLSNQDFFTPGKKLEIDIGYESKVENVFKGIVVKNSITIRESGASFLEVTCKHPIVKLTTRKTNRSFYDVTDRDAVSQLLEETGVKYQVSDMESVKHMQLVQFESTSWDFIVSRADSNASLVFFDAEKCYVQRPSLKEKETINCTYGSNVLRFDAGMDSEAQFPGVQSRSWSSADQEVISRDGTESFTNEIGNITTKKLSEVLNNEPFPLQHSANLSDQELSAWAESRATKNELSKVQGSVTVLGTSKIYPGKVIQLSGFGDRFSGKAYVTGVRHQVAQGNWTVDIQFGLSPTWFSQQKNFNPLPAAGLLPAVNGLQLGIVTQLEGDPEKEFRVRVKIPIINADDDGIWAHVAKLYAGNDYGMCFLPEINDDVVIGFLNDDPRKAVVLGVVHSSAKASPLAHKDDNHQKALVSRSGMKMVWDDEKKSVSLSTPAGHQLTLDEDAKTVTVKDMHGNKMVMDNNGITVQSATDLTLKAAKNIQLQGVNVNVKASGKFSAEGNAGAEVKTSSIAVLKGSLVQIN